MWKPVLAGTVAVVVVAGSSLVYAQQRPGRTENVRRWQPNLEDMRAFGDARLAALKAGLALTPEQEQYWAPFEQAARDVQKLRQDRISKALASRREGESRAADPAERLSERAAAMTETGTALKKLADAMGPLYKSLDDNQKRRFATLGRMLRSHEGHGGRHFRGHDGGSFMWDRRERRSEGSDRMTPDHDTMPGTFQAPSRGADGGERL